MNISGEVLKSGVVLVDVVEVVWVVVVLLLFWLCGLMVIFELVDDFDV